MKNIVIFDIDRCILDPKERIHHYLNKDFETYESLWHTDTPIKQGVEVYKTFLNNDTWRCIFITSRREWARETTYKQLLMLFGMRKFTLLMRPNDCTKEMKDDAAIKPWLLERAGFSIHDVFIAFDDRQSVVDRWRELGVVCYQTAADAEA